MLDRASPEDWNEKADSDCGFRVGRGVLVRGVVRAGHLAGGTR